MAAIPARRKISAPLPSRRPAPARRPATKRAAARQPTGAFVLDKLLSGRAWIGLVFVLLAGIVFFNVDLLQMNREIARNADRAAAVKTENARLRTDLARLGSSERIQQVAAQAGLVLPAPGEVRYLRADPTADAKRAATRIDRGKASAPPAPAAVPPAQDPDPEPPPALAPAAEAPVAAPVEQSEPVQPAAQVQPQPTEP
jgi:cell division protein FtsL